MMSKINQVFQQLSKKSGRGGRHKQVRNIPEMVDDSDMEERAISEEFALYSYVPDYHRKEDREGNLLQGSTKISTNRLQEADAG